MIEVRALSKRHGKKLAADGLSFSVAPGSVTGFLGPNGAGRSTTMRMIVGLDHPTSGHATINGLPYAHLPRPLRVVGALLEAGACTLAGRPTTTCCPWRCPACGSTP